MSRHRRSDDERSVEVRLTGRGRRLRERARPLPEAICAATGLTAPEIADLVGRLHDLVNAVQADLGSRVAPNSVL